MKPVQETSVTPYRGLVSEKPLNIMVYTRRGQWRPRFYGRFEIFLSVPMKSSFVIAEKVGREVWEVGVINNFPLDSYVSVHET